MCTNILTETAVSFKEIEQSFFEAACALARAATIELLRELDENLAKERDKSVYRDKGLRSNTIKTVYGEVEYSRHVYIRKNEDGKNEAVYLLDKELGMTTIGKISTNLLEKVLGTAIEASFRNAADQITGTTGQSISHGGVWNAVQLAGEKLEEEENHLIKDMQAEQPKGGKEIPVLFEEMDGVYLKSQTSGGKKGQGLEVKAGTMYEGWEKDTGKRSVLSGKTVVAGIMSSEEFHELWEAKIQSIYDPEKIGMRILNGDGGSWIKDEYDAGAIQQLDRFHLEKMIREKTSDESMQEDMLSLLKANKAKELVEMGQIYYDSISTKEGETKEEEKAGELKEYLKNHKDELLLYKDRDIIVPEAPEGIEYKNMGVQENQNCTLVTLRMKGKRRRWAKDGANNMLRLLYFKQNHELAETIERIADGEVWIEPILNEQAAPLSAAKVPAVDGKGKNRYVERLNKHLTILDSANSRTTKVFKRLIY